MGFLSAGPVPFAPVILAPSAVLSGLISGRILFREATLASFGYEMAAIVILESRRVSRSAPVSPGRSERSGFGGHVGAPLGAGA